MANNFIDEADNGGNIANATTSIEGDTLLVLALQYLHQDLVQEIITCCDVTNIDTNKLQKHEGVTAE